MNLAAIILAGGYSRRMGTDKALLPSGDGHSLLDRQFELARAVGAHPVRVSVRPGQSYEGYEAKCLVDAWPGMGPLGGIATGLRAGDATHLLAIAVDLPCLTDGVLGELWRACVPGCGAIPVSALGTEPLVAIYPAAGLAEAEARLRSGRLRVREFAAALSRLGLLREMPLAGMRENAVRNCNTPGELAQTHVA